MGLGDSEYRTSPQKNDFFDGKKVKEIFANGYGSFALLEDGTLYSWGRNEQGQLGLGNKEHQIVPQEIHFFSDKPILKLETGDFHTLAILEDGTAYVWGYNDGGQLGLGHKTSLPNPTLLNTLPDSKIKDAFLGQYHSMTLLENGEVYVWGRNDSGELGLGHENEVLSPKISQSLSDLNVLDINIGYDHSLVMTKDGKVYTLGRNNYGHLGLGEDKNVRYSTPQLLNTISNVVQIVVGNSLNLALTEDGELYGWGRNENGQLGLGHKDSPYSTPVKINLPN